MSSACSDQRLTLRCQFRDSYQYESCTKSGAIPEERPFLSIITRTMGTRTVTLRETLMSLAGQSLQDFEVFIVVHSPAVERVEAVKALVDEFPLSLTKRINVIQCIRPGRSSPLNDAIEKVSGEYVSVLDDDDFVFSNWVETFKRVALEKPFSMVRAVCVRQDYQANFADEGLVPRATSWFKLAWPTTYDAVSHLFGNFTPFMSVAIPIEAFKVLRLRWDETLSTAEDWEITTHVAMNFGVACSGEISAVYRWWTDGESSSFVHSSEEWRANERRILESFDRRPIMLPPGSVTRIRELLNLETHGRGEPAAEGRNVAVRIYDEALTATLRRKDRPFRRLLKRLRKSIRKRLRSIVTINNW